MRENLPGVPEGKQVEWDPRDSRRRCQKVSTNISFLKIYYFSYPLRSRTVDNMQLVQRWCCTSGLTGNCDAEDLRTTS